MSKDRFDTIQGGSGSQGAADIDAGWGSAHTPFQSALLAAGRSDALPTDRREVVFRNLAVTLGAPHGLEGADLGAQTALKASAKVAGVEGLALKAVGAIAVTGALVWGGWQGFFGQAASAPAMNPPDVAASVVPGEGPAPSPAEPQGAPVGVEQVVDGDNAALAALDANNAGKGRARTKTSDSLAKELSLIDAARAALLRGEPSSALRTLQTYRTQFPRGALQAEATVQRVEALIATGDRGSASKIGEAFLRRYPDSPYSRRIVSLLGGTREPQVDGARKSK